MTTGLGFIKTVFLTASEGIVISNESGHIIAVNPKGAEMFGYTVEELEHKSIEQLIPRNVVQSHAKYRKGYFKDPSPRPMGHGRDLNGLRKDGSVFPLEISLTHFREEEENFVVAFVIDITMRKELEGQKTAYTIQLQDEVKKRTEELNQLNQGLREEIQERKAVELALRKSEDLYKHLAKNYPNGSINVLDRSLNYLIAGGVRIHDQIDVLSDEWVGNSFVDQLPEQHRELLHGYLTNALLGVSSSCEYECDEVTVIMHTVPILDEKKEVDKLLVVEENITEQKKAQNDIQMALYKERELNELKSRFVSMASHEFRTPLATILSSTDLLERYTQDHKSDKTDKHFNRIKTNIDGLTNILNDFLSLEKLETGGIRVDKSMCDIRAFTASVIEETKPLLKLDQFFQVNDNLSNTKYLIDQKIIKNVLLNLISNAIKYSPEGRPITINLEGDQTLLSLEVKDQGIGIPEEDQHKMFERFFRANNSSNIQGTGLGLFIVKKYIDLLNGEISLDSEEGVGTTIKIDIPNE